MQFKQNDKAMRRKNPFALSCSYIYNKIAALISESIIIGFFTDMLSRDSSSKEIGIIHSPLKKPAVFNKILKSRVFLARKYETSILGRLLKHLYITFFSLPLRSVSVFLMTFGAILAFGSTLSSKGITLPLDSSNFITGVAVTAISVILFPSRKSIYSHIYQSKFFSLFCSDSLLLTGISDKPLPGGYLSAFFMGLICAIISFVFTPSKILLFLIALLFTCVIFNSPETGVLLIISFLPILSTAYIFYLIFVTFLSYMFKYMIGKRHFNTNDTDIMLFIAALVVVFSGIFTASGISGFTHAVKILTCVLFAVLMSNLVRSAKTSMKCTSMLVGGTFAVCIFNLILFVFQHTKISDELSLHFSVTDFIGVVNIFSGSNELGVFTATLIPLIFSFSLFGSNTGKTRYSVLLSMLFVNVLISGNPIAFCVSVISLIIVLAFRNKTWLLLIIPCMIFWNFIKAIPGAILDIAGMGSLGADISAASDNTSSILAYISEYGLFGMGLGYENMSASIDVIENSANNTPAFGTLLESVFVTLGLFGLLFVITLIVSFMSKTYNYVVHYRDKDERIVTACIGLFVSCLNFILLSIFTYTASDTRLILLFTAYLTLSCAAVKSSMNDYISECVVREHINNGNS